MHALTKGAIGVTVLAVLGGPPPSFRPLVAPAVPSALPSASSLATETWRCPPRSLPIEVGEASDAQTCLPLPDLDAQPDARRRRVAELPPTPTFLKLTAPTESIPRLPERPEAYGAYQMPVDPVVMVATDLDSPAPGERPKLGVSLVTNASAPVTLVPLERETGRPEVMLVGELYGMTVVVKHVVESADADGKREYLVFYGNLDRLGPNITSGAFLSPMSVIGFVGDGESEEPSVYLEVRRQDDALSGPAEHLSQLVTKSVSVDPRNVLPLIAK